ncbi:nuclear transport factor 2 family protein [Nocardioides piscis]|uniref:Nuclear transport factor 2 family protein n=1 Tax=Nocardioides piscis TaxID=2714938 RepID=A0A6G7YGD7_9ACTN|nr:nuclear transport factor 2 family protein [Nocardioides piscis]QIK75840.1 nuclear transport factor 2 family protein [Nocardioides piscis]
MSTSTDFSRAEIDQFWQTWLEANRKAEASNDWGVLAEHYAEDATYGWMYTPDEHFMAVGREQIRDWALGTEMQGLDGWHYDYVATVTDETTGMVVGFWKQKAGITDDETGKEYQILGLGGSWFGIVRVGDGADSGQLKIGWQRDWFDLGSTAHTFLTLAGSGKAPQPLLDRMGLKGMDQPGHYRRADLPSTVWPPVVGDE